MNNNNLYLMRHGFSCANTFQLQSKKKQLIEYVKTKLGKDYKPAELMKNAYEWFDGDDNVDSYLTELGMLQSYIAGKKVIIELEHFYTSSMFRAIQTCYFFLLGRFVVHDLKEPIIINITPLLRETGTRTSDKLHNNNEIENFYNELLNIDFLNKLFASCNKFASEFGIDKIDINNINDFINKISFNIIEDEERKQNKNKFLNLVEGKNNVLAVSHNHTINKNYCGKSIKNTEIIKYNKNKCNIIYNPEISKEIFKEGKKYDKKKIEKFLQQTFCRKYNIRKNMNSQKNFLKIFIVKEDREKKNNKKNNASVRINSIKTELNKISSATSKEILNFDIGFFYFENLSENDKLLKSIYDNICSIYKDKYNLVSESISNKKVGIIVRSSLFNSVLNKINQNKNNGCSTKMYKLKNRNNSLENYFKFKCKNNEILVKMKINGKNVTFDKYTTIQNIHNNFVPVISMNNIVPEIQQQEQQQINNNKMNNMLKRTQQQEQQQINNNNINNMFKRTQQQEQQQINNNKMNNNINNMFKRTQQQEQQEQQQQNENMNNKIGNLTRQLFNNKENVKPLQQNTKNKSGVNETPTQSVRKTIAKFEGTKMNNSKKNLLKAYNNKMIELQELNSRNNKKSNDTITRKKIKNELHNLRKQIREHDPSFMKYRKSQYDKELSNIPISSKAMMNKETEPFRKEYQDKMEELNKFNREKYILALEKGETSQYKKERNSLKNELHKIRKRINNIDPVSVRNNKLEKREIESPSLQAYKKSKQS